MQRWSEVVTTNLWPFALKNECKIANKVKLKDGVSAEEKYAKVERKQKLDTYHPFGCPVFVLDAALQGSLSKIPRWDPRSRVGIYLGHSPKHARSVALVLNIATGHISPQYHLVFDDDFTTVQSMRVRKIPVNWEGLVTRQR